jgi:hypothetical protein
MLTCWLQVLLVMRIVETIFVKNHKDVHYIKYYENRGVIGLFMFILVYIYKLV